MAVMDTPWCRESYPHDCNADCTMCKMIWEMHEQDDDYDYGAEDDNEQNGGKQ